MKPPRYTDNPARFANVNLYTTDLEKTFARVRKELALRARVEKSADAAPVIQMRRIK